MRLAKHLLLSALLVSPCLCDAVQIIYSVTFQGGSRWTYEYSIKNNSAFSIQEFSIYFPYATTTSLMVTASSPDWDTLVLQPDTGLPADGIFDSLNLQLGLPAGASVSGFRVGFDFKGTGTPGPQHFDVLDPVTFSVRESGMTALAQIPAIPEPELVLQLSMGLALTAGALSRKHSTKKGSAT